MTFRTHQRGFPPGLQCQCLLRAGFLTALVFLICCPGAYGQDDNQQGDEESVSEEATPEFQPDEGPPDPDSTGPDLSPYFRSEPDWFGYSSPVQVQIFGGESYAEPGSFLALDWFKPLQTLRYEDGSETVGYLDIRGGLNFDSGGLGNFGLGRRHYFAGSDVIADGSLWYDVDGSNQRLFHQIAGGGQLRIQNVLVRGHYYLPVLDTRSFTHYSELTGNVGFQGNTLALERFRYEDQAFEGFDAEAGVNVPQINNAQFLVGYYSFHAEGKTDITGVSTTALMDIFTNCTVGVQATFDRETDETVMLTASYLFSSRTDRPRPDHRHLLGEFVRRTRHIVSRSESFYDPVAALDATGNRINIIHASSAGGNNGTFESPYTDLSLAAADAAMTPGSIILAHANSVFNGQSVTLPNDTRLLGDGITWQITTQQLGTVDLPRATSGTVLPIIRNSPGVNPAVTLANSTEVNGLRIESAGGVGLFGNGLTSDVLIRDVVIDGATTGFHLQNSGNVAVSGLTVENTSGTGILLDSIAGTVTFSGPANVRTAAAEGILIRNTAASGVVTFENSLNISDTGSQGLRLLDNLDSSSITFNGTTTVQNTVGNGLEISNPAAATVHGGNVTFAGPLVISGAAASGLVIQETNALVTLGSTDISDWGTSAIVLDRLANDFSLAAPLTLNNVNASAASTLMVTGVTRNVQFGDVTITDTARVVPGAATVHLLENNTGVFDITFNSLNITSVNATALRAEESGTNIGTLRINSGTITSTGAAAVHLNGISTDISLTSVSATATPVGIELIQVGTRTAFHQKFEIVGQGTTGSGGTLSGVQQGILISGSQDIILHSMNIDSTIAGVSVLQTGTSQPVGLTFDGLSLTDAGGTANWTGFDIAYGNSAHLSDPTRILNSQIAGSGAGQTGIRIVNNQSLPEMPVQIDGNTISLTGLGTTGVSLTANGLMPGQVTNIGGLTLTSSVDNVISNAVTPFISATSNDATINGQVLINGVPQP